jgi:1-acyl-sn-glycerol-3-phosphate acyltransferase
MIEPLLEPSSSAPAGPPARRPEARTSPEALARRRGGVREGLDWLGRSPEPTAGPLFRVIAIIFRFLAFGVLRLRHERLGSEHAPATGGYIVVGAVHRGWMDPFLIMNALPREPRIWFLGSGPSAFSARWREWLLHRVGGMLPVWRGGVGIDQHVASARAVVAAGAVFVLIPEGGVAGPPDRLAPFRFGSALIALRTGAPILPIVIAGSAELYVGRRMATRLLGLTTVAELLGPDWPAGGRLPDPGSRAELDLAHRLTDRFADLLGPAVAELYPRTVDPPGRPRRLRGLTWLFLARPKAHRPAESRDGP